MIRRALPALVLPLCLAASILDTTPWLRAFPAGVAALPLLGAAVISVLLPVAMQAFTARLWISALVGLGAFVVYTLLVVLHAGGPATLADGLYRGPSQLLTFALPLVSPRSLLVVPVALSWLVGAIGGECASRRWPTVVPHAGFVLAFALAYAGTERAAGDDRLRETLLAGALLGVLLLMRAAQVWVRQDEDAEPTQPDGVLPVRGFAVGAVTALAIAVIAGLVVQAGAFPKRSATPQRVPSVDSSRPVDPLAFVAGLRPDDPKAAGRAAFTVRLHGTAPGYFDLANVDVYDGAGWTFRRTFRPSGGVLPADADAALRSHATPVAQDYTIAPDSPLAGAPWLPALYRARDVTGVAVDIDPASGMIVPAGRLAAGDRYTVTSAAATATFDGLRTATAVPDAATPGTETELPPGTLRATLDQLVRAFSRALGVPSSPAVPFLQALTASLRRQYALSTPDQPPTSAPSAPSTSSPAPSLPAPASAPAAAQQRAGSTTFADVAASILGPDHSGTPEQFATLVALVARDLGVPARLGTGFRLPGPGDVARLAAGTYTLTTADAWTWVEIPLIGRGWVVLDAAPGTYRGARQQSQGASPAPSSSPPSSPNRLLTSGNGGNAVAPPSRVPHARTAPHRVWPALLVAAGVVALLLLLTLLARKPARARRRRRAADPRDRLLGAWQEGLDRLAEAGLPELRALTSSEIAELTGARFGPRSRAPADALGAAANAAAYRTSVAVLPAEAEAAWRSERELDRTLRRGLGLGARLAYLFRYHRRDRAPRPAGAASWRESATAPGARPAGAATSRGPRRLGRHRRAH